MSGVVDVDGGKAAVDVESRSASSDSSELGLSWSTGSDISGLLLSKRGNNSVRYLFNLLLGNCELPEVP